MAKKHKLNKGLLIDIVLVVLSIACLSLPFMHYQAGWLALIAPLPVIFLLSRIKRYGRSAQVFILWLVGFVSISIVLQWLLQTQPERWTAFTGVWAIALLVLGWLIMSLSLSAGWWLFGFVWTRLKLNMDDKYIWLALPALWVLCEYLRSYVFSIVSFGTSTTIGPYWGLGVVGNAVGVTPIGFSARLVGFYGLSALVVILNIAIFKLIIKPRQLLIPIGGIISILIISMVSYLVYLPSKDTSYKVSAVQLGVDSNLNSPGADYYSSFDYKQDPTNSDILVTPEYSQFFEFKDTQEDPKKLLEKTLQPNGVAITSMTENVDDKHYNKLVVYNRQGEIIDSQRKQFLIPVGESTPYLLAVPLRLLGKGSELDTLTASREVSKGDKPIRLTDVNGYKIGALVCSGAVAPFQYQGLVREGAVILTNSASLSIFEKANTYHQQTQQIARTVAIATNRPFAQSTDGSYSYIIDKDGNYLAKSSLTKLEVISANVRAGKNRTVYDFLGEWVVLVSAAVLLTITVQFWNNKRKNNK